VAHALSARGVNLPTYLELTGADLDVICAAVRDVLTNREAN
jgi:dTDP-4-amino-4,6-dideoxygalactose transaminase